jgi:hypothetical protein
MAVPTAPDDDIAVAAPVAPAPAPLLHLLLPTDLLPRDLHALLLAGLAVVVTLKLNLLYPSVFLAFFSVAALALLGSQTVLGGQLGRGVRADRDAAAALADLYAKHHAPALGAAEGEAVWDADVVVPRPARLAACLVDRAVVRALLQLHRRFWHADRDAVARAAVLAERFYALYFHALARRTPAPGTRGRWPDAHQPDAQEAHAHHHELRDVRRALLNHVQTLHVSASPARDAAAHIDRITRTLQARTYKCLNNLSNKAAFPHKHPSPAVLPHAAALPLPHSFALFV